MKIHKSITLDRLIEAVESELFGLENPGFCVACGHEASGVEPDACKLKCEACGENGVYGAEELIIRL